MKKSRREFLYTLGMGALAIPALACTSSDSKENLSDRQAGNQSTMNQKKLGIALVGLGSYAGGQLAPALQETDHCYLAGIVTGTPSKIPTWKERYKIADGNVYNYQNFDSIKENKDIDIVYVVLPNSMHAEYVIRAAAAGKHVICEKPMAITVEDCDRMIDACKKAGKMLSIGYRLHFEPHNLEMMRIGAERPLGLINKIIAENGLED